MRFLLQKMEVTHANPISYCLVSAKGVDQIVLNSLIGKQIQLHFHGDSECLHCGLNGRIFSQGFCYACAQTCAETSECILRPELCQGHLGMGRDPQFEFEQHVQSHFVYLAATSAIKVGVTRTHQRPARWIDQGAISAVAIAETPYRALAGQIEVALKSIFSDKTPREKMLRGEDNAGIQLQEQASKVLAVLPSNLKRYILEEEKWDLFGFSYPVLSYPVKPKTLKLDRPFSWSGTLLGIRGQYLLLEGDLVFNVRSHSGYWLELSCEAQ